MVSFTEMMQTCSTFAGMVTLLTALGAGFAFLWKQGRDSRQEMRIHHGELKTELKEEMKGFKDELKEAREEVQSISHQLTGVDRRLYGVETLLHMKECCLLKSNQHIKEAE